MFDKNTSLRTQGQHGRKDHSSIYSKGWALQRQQVPFIICWWWLGGKGTGGIKTNGTFLSTDPTQVASVGMMWVGKTFSPGPEERDQPFVKREKGKEYCKPVRRATPMNKWGKTAAERGGGRKALIRENHHPLTANHRVWGVRGRKKRQERASVSSRRLHWSISRQ